MRLDFMIKLYFALGDDPAPARQILAAQLEAMRDYAAEIEHDALDAGAGDFARIVMESRAPAARITLEWLRTSLDELSSRRTSRRPAAKRGAAKAAV